MDANRFDNLTRTIGKQNTRRDMLKAAAGSALAVVGVAAAGRVARGQGVTAEARGFKGDDCSVDSSVCKQGLICNTDKGKCEYKNKDGGTKGQACQEDNDCRDDRNLVCDDRECTRNGRNKK